MQVIAPYQVVLLVRGEQSKTPFYAMPHELDVLNQMFGEANVRMTDAEPPTKESVFDPADEYARMEKAYSGEPGELSPVRHVYRKLSDFEEYCNKNYVHKRSGITKLNAAESEGLTFDINEDKDSLFYEAISLGIDAKKTWGVAKLQAAINEARG